MWRGSSDPLKVSRRVVTPPWARDALVGSQAVAVVRRRRVPVRRRAADLACRDSAFVDTVFFGSRLSLWLIARERFADGRVRFRPARVAAFALRLVDALALRGGGGRLMPARRAFERPIAIACFADRAPCLPSRTCSISSCTNSPAWVVGDLPARLAARAFSHVFFSGIPFLLSRSRCRAAIPWLSVCAYNDFRYSTTSSISGGVRPRLNRVL